MTELVSLNDEKQKRVRVGELLNPECIYCGKRELHPGYSCPRIASLSIDEDGHIWQVEFHDWLVEGKGEDE